VVGEEDMKVVNSIAQNDRIESIRIDGDTAPLLAAHKADVDAWSDKLSKS
jgi:peptidyl-prolyl cis-trans isomerase B (cyclophilin B)